MIYGYDYVVENDVGRKTVKLTTLYLSLIFILLVRVNPITRTPGVTREYTLMKTSGQLHRRGL